MDHQVVEQENFADRYVMGQLTAEEQATFNAHFIDCQACLDQIEASESFRRGLLAVAAEETEKARAMQQISLFARLVRAAARRPAMLLVGIVLMAAIPMGLLYLDWRTRPPSPRPQTESAELQKQLEEQRQNLELLQQQMQQSQQQWGKERKELESQIAQAKISDTAHRRNGNLDAAPVFSLDATRGTDESQNTKPGRVHSQPETRVVVSRSTPLVILYLEVEPDPDIASYRAILTRSGQRVIWKQDEMKMSTREGLILSLGSHLLQSGDYLLTLEGLTVQRSYVPVKRFPFRVLTRL